jgi:phosphinothricin acetyltransferase
MQIMTDRAIANIRPAVEQDAAGMLAIYAPVVESTAIPFETELPTLSEFRFVLPEPRSLLWGFHAVRSAFVRNGSAVNRC